jgi:hypothetical protein
MMMPDEVRGSRGASTVCEGFRHIQPLALSGAFRSQQDQQHQRWQLSGMCGSRHDSARVCGNTDLSGLKQTRGSKVCGSCTLEQAGATSLQFVAC